MVFANDGMVSFCRNRVLVNPNDCSSSDEQTWAIRPRYDKSTWVHVLIALELEPDWSSLDVRSKTGVMIHEHENFRLSHTWNGPAS
jgi:hypothetical protein